MPEKYKKIIRFVLIGIIILLFVVPLFINKQDDFKVISDCKQVYNSDMHKYRIGDMVRGIHLERSDGKEWHMENYPGTIIYDYFKATSKPNDVQTLNFIIQKRLSKLDKINDIALHLRIGDVIDNNKEHNFTDMIEKSIKWPNSGIQYVTSWPKLKSLLDKLPTNIKDITIFAGSHNVENPTKSCKYIDRMVKLLNNQGYTVKLRLGQHPDEDLVLMSTAPYFIPSGGGFSNLVNDIRKSNNMKIIDYNTQTKESFNTDKLPEKTQQFIRSYSSMVHLNNHKPSEERLRKIRKIWEKYGVFPKLFAGLNSKNANDLDVLAKLPIVKSKFETRIGAYGLAGSFYNVLKTAYESEQPYLLYMEDDAVPSINPQMFNQTFMEAIDTLPDPLGCYTLSVTVYCEYKQPLTRRWESIKYIKSKNWGSPALLFTRKSIRKLLEHVEDENIDVPVDHLIKNIYGNSLYFWNDIISANGMFLGLFAQYGSQCTGRENIMENL
jgi:GR25 family glycosyltransferase involved in LPS biosynthesis